VVQCAADDSLNVQPPSHAMKKFSIPSLVVIALVVGLGCSFQAGCWTHRHFYDPIQHDLQLRVQLDKGDTVVRAPKLLRDGNTNTVPFLETQLDDVMITLGRPVAATPKGERGRRSF
jgi:hypothetical protein